MGANPSCFCARGGVQHLDRTASQGKHIHVCPEMTCQIHSVRLFKTHTMNLSAVHISNNRVLIVFIFCSDTHNHYGNDIR